MRWYQKPLFVFGLIAVIFTIYGFAVELKWLFFSGKDASASGTFGDSFGALTAFFSALAFGGLMITIWQQQTELSLTREEMKDQKFENMLFKMLEIFASIVGDLDLRSKALNNQQTATGRDCFAIFIKRLRVHYAFYQKKNAARPPQEIIDQAYDYFWKKNRNNLGHYFRYIYNIFKFIENDGRNDKKIYGNIVRAQLSDYELCLLYYNCISKFGRERFKPLAIEYELFDNMPKELLIEPTHETLYPPKAFGR